MMRMIRCARVGGRSRRRSEEKDGGSVKGRLYTRGQTPPQRTPLLLLSADLEKEEKEEEKVEEED